MRSISETWRRDPEEVNGRIKEAIVDAFGRLRQPVPMTTLIFDVRGHAQKDLPKVSRARIAIGLDRLLRDGRLRVKQIMGDAGERVVFSLKKSNPNHQ